MADDADFASEQREKEMAVILAAAPRPGGQSANYCLDCGEPIPEKRRLAYAGCFRCVDCQADAARRS